MGDRCAAYEPYGHAPVCGQTDYPKRLVLEVGQRLGRRGWHHAGSSFTLGLPG
jgi:hypothetical protein